MFRFNSAFLLIILFLICSNGQGQDSGNRQSTPITQTGMSDSADAPPPPPPAPPVSAQDIPSCIPSCRDGFVCHQNVCIPACNPPCGFGQQCMGAGQCVSVDTNPPAPSHGAIENDPKGMIRAKRVALRMKYRESPRLSTSFMVAITWCADDQSTLDAIGVLPSLGIGFRKNVLSMFGLWVEAGLLAGAIMVNGNTDEEDEDYSQSDATSAQGFFIDAGIYAGPFARMYFGPVLGILGLRMRDNTLTIGDSATREDDFQIDDRVFGMFGAKAGLLLGRKEQINLFIMATSTFSPNTMPVYGGVGISLDIPGED